MHVRDGTAVPRHGRSLRAALCVSPVSCWLLGRWELTQRRREPRCPGQWPLHGSGGAGPGTLPSPAGGTPTAPASELSQSQFCFLVLVMALCPPGAFWNLARMPSIWNAVALSLKGRPRHPDWRGLCAVPRPPGGAWPAVLGTASSVFSRGIWSRNSEGSLLGAVLRAALRPGWLLAALGVGPRGVTAFPLNAAGCEPAPGDPGRPGNRPRGHPPAGALAWQPGRVSRARFHYLEARGIISTLPGARGPDVRTRLSNSRCTGAASPVQTVQHAGDEFPTVFHWGCS